MTAPTTTARPAGHLPDHDVRPADRTNIQRPAGIGESLATACALLVCVMARIPHRLVDAADIHGLVLRLVAVVVVVSGARCLARAPFTFVRSSSGRRWAATETKTLVVTALVGSALSLPLYALLRATPLWWLYAAALFAAVSVVGQLTAPFILRLESGRATAAPPELARRVHDVAALAGVHAGPVLVTGRPGRSGCNAYVAGLGSTRRIVLDGTLASWPGDLVDQVVAHEVGHCRLRHGARRLPLTLVAQAGTFAFAAVVLSWTPLLHWAGVTSAGDPRSFPLLLVVTPLLALPARCLLAWRDRSQEREADEFALMLLASPNDFTTMLDRAAAEGGAVRDLPWWRRAVASHPPIDERVRTCTRFASTV